MLHSPYDEGVTLVQVVTVVLCHVNLGIFRQLEPVTCLSFPLLDHIIKENSKNTSGVTGNTSTIHCFTDSRKSQERKYPIG